MTTEEELREQIQQHAVPPRARMKQDLIQLPLEDNYPLPLMRKKHSNSESTPLFFKKNNPFFVELEAYSASICQFIATAEYVPNTRPYWKNRIPIGISSKMIPGFRSTRDDPLLATDLLLNSASLKTEFTTRTAKLITQDLLDYYDETLGMFNRFKRMVASFTNPGYWFERGLGAQDVRAQLLRYINNPHQVPVETVLSAIEQRQADLNSTSKEARLSEQLRQALITFQGIHTAYVPGEFSIELLERFDQILKAKGTDLVTCSGSVIETIDGVTREISVQDLQHYRIMKGLGVCLTTRFIFQEGDNHRLQFSKTGQFIDFGWTKSHLFFSARFTDSIDRLMREPRTESFACTPHNIQHFPDIIAPNLFYWPTKQPEIFRILKQSLDALQIEFTQEFPDQFNPVFNELLAPMIMHVFDNFTASNSLTQLADKMAANFYASIKSYLTGRPLHQVIMQVKVTQASQIVKSYIQQLLTDMDTRLGPMDATQAGLVIHKINETISTLDNNSQNILSYVETQLTSRFSPLYTEAVMSLIATFLYELMDEMKKLNTELDTRYQGYRQNAFTIEDNIRFKLLAGHPAFIFHKYKTLLKYLLTDMEIYRIFTELNICRENDYASKVLIDDELQRFQEIQGTLANLEDFHNFLREHGSFAFELIREECHQLQEKYRNKTKERFDYDRLVPLLDSAYLETKFQALCRECGLYDDEENALPPITACWV